MKTSCVFFLFAILYNIRFVHAMESKEERKYMTDEKKKQFSDAPMDNLLFDVQLEAVKKIEAMFRATHNRKEVKQQALKTNQVATTNAALVGEELLFQGVQGEKQLHENKNGKNGSDGTDGIHTGDVSTTNMGAQALFLRFGTLACIASVVLNIIISKLNTEATVYN